MKKVYHSIAVIVFLVIILSWLSGSEPEPCFYNTHETNDLKQLAVAVRSYNVEHSKDLNSLEQLPGLYEHALKDSWGNEYCIDTAEQIVFSKGKDRIPSTADDIIISY